MAKMPSSKPKSTDECSFLSGNVRFSSLLVRTILEGNRSNKNFVFDCMGVVTQLSGIHAAANDSVHQKIEELLGVGKAEPEPQADAAPGCSYNEVSEILKSVSFKHEKTILGQRVEKKTSLALIDCSYYPATAFISDLKSFGIGTKVVDFQSQNPLKSIKKKLVTILKRRAEYNSLSNPRNKMILINEGTIQKDWTRAFNKRRALPFYSGPEKGTYLAKYLTVTAQFRVGDLPELSAHIVQLPYSGQNQSMFIILPKDTRAGALQAMEKTLCHQDAWCLWNTLVANLVPKLTYLAVPEFDFNTFINMKPILEQLGMPELFDSQANVFSAVSEQADFCISEYYQINHAIIAEKGQLGALREVQRKVLLMSEPTGVVTNFVVDHPFLFIIQDEATKSMLYIGRVCHPLKANRFSRASSLLE